MSPSPKRSRRCKQPKPRKRLLAAPQGRRSSRCIPSSSPSEEVDQPASATKTVTNSPSPILISSSPPKGDTDKSHTLLGPCSSSLSTDGPRPLKSCFKAASPSKELLNEAFFPHPRRVSWQEGTIGASCHFFSFPTTRSTTLSTRSIIQRSVASVEPPSEDTDSSDSDSTEEEPQSSFHIFGKRPAASASSTSSLLTASKPIDEVCDCNDSVQPQGHKEDLAAENASKHEDIPAHLIPRLRTLYGSYSEARAVATALHAVGARGLYYESYRAEDVVKVTCIETINCPWRVDLCCDKSDNGRGVMIELWRCVVIDAAHDHSQDDHRLLSKPADVGAGPRDRITSMTKEGYLVPIRLARTYRGQHLADCSESSSDSDWC